MKPIIGILGGSGPEAGLYITHLLHQYAQQAYHATQDLEYPDYILYNKPLAGFGNTGVVDEKLVIASFVEAIHKLIDMGANIIGVACNTLHIYVNQIHLPLGITFCNLIEECVQELPQDKSNVLILSSETVNTTGLYATKIKNSVSLLSHDQEIINDIIEKVMGNVHGKKENDLINAMIIKYQKTHNIQCVVLGCTELPLAFCENETNIPVINSNSILAKALVETYKKY